MIVSFHPVISADHHRLCAGRDPDHEDTALMRSAGTVILPQGCRESLYEAAKKNCRRVFPNYDARFTYPGKSGQARLFPETGVPHPRTYAFETLDNYYQNGMPPLVFPLVFKFDWGGEGETVFFVQNETELAGMLRRARLFEASGQRGFLLQEYIPCNGRCLRVAVIGEKRISYWRVAEKTRGPFYHASLAKGGVIDAAADPDLQKKAIQITSIFCHKTGINLAGLDFIFHAVTADPYMLEINYFFGRKGLGGSENFYHILKREVTAWIGDSGPHPDREA